MNKKEEPIAIIYVNPTADSTKILNDFLAKHINQLNMFFYVKRINVTSKNVKEVRRRGIDNTPTLVYNNRKFVSLENIIKVLTPPADQKDHYGYGNTNPDDLIEQNRKEIIDDGDDDNDDDNLDNRDTVIRQKMAALQKLRPEMNDVDKKSKISGGRKIKPIKNAKQNYDTDDEFRKASNVDNITETPTKRYMTEEDGDLILEEYFLNEAMMNGKKVGNKVSRKR